MWSELENKIYEEIKQKERKGWRKLKSLKYCKSLLSLFNVSYISDTVSKGCVIRKKPLVKWLLCQRGGASFSSEDSECGQSGSRSGL